MYRVMVVKYSPRAKDMAARVERAANKMEQAGYNLVSCSGLPSGKGILVFHQAAEAAAGSVKVPDVGPKAE